MYLWFRGSGTTFGGDEPMVDMFISDITEGTTDLDYLMALPIEVQCWVWTSTRITATSRPRQPTR